MSDNNNKIPLIIAAFIILVVLTVVVAKKLTTDSGDFIDLVGALLAFLASSMAVMVSIIVLTSQNKTMKQVEILKKDLEKGFEFHKQRQNAYRTLFGASTALYYALSELSIGVYKNEAIDVATKGMVEACWYVMYVSPEDEHCWMAFWQIATRIEEEARSVFSAEEYKRIWSNHLPTIGHLARTFQEAAKRAVSDRTA